uniref:mitochondrial outer membrane protein porin 2-like n=1 Tax=Erigeron canadensis TaxID=72917 RepID=UPI001CB92477|nr:mitochondrial outer membrane protein porin 2-like [Erigeron canadensis]
MATSKNRNPKKLRKTSNQTPPITSSPTTMKTGPGLFSNFGKVSQDVLTKDYLLDRKLSISTTSVTGMTFTSTTTNKNGVPAADVEAVYKSKKASIGVNLDAKLNINLNLTGKDLVPSTNTSASFKLGDFKSSKVPGTLSITEIAPSTKTIASFQLPDFKPSKLEVYYFHQHATLTSTMALNQTPTVDVSATFGTTAFALGAKAAYEASSSKFLNFAIGINVNSPHSTASMVLDDKGDTVKASYLQYFNVSRKTAAAAEITRKLSKNKTDYVVGGCYAFDHRTMVKARLTNCTKLSALLQHEIVPKSIVTLSSELDIKALHKTPKFGLALVLKL